MLAKEFILTLITGVCMAGSNALLLIEFMGKPEMWGNDEMYIFITTIGVTFGSIIVLQEVKKHINDGLDNLV